MAGRRKAPYRICFGGSPVWQRVVDDRLDRRQFVPQYDLSAARDIDAFDAVAPLRIDDYPAIRDIPGIASKAILPPPAIVDLCDDKLALDERLRDLGFGALTPGRPGDGPAAFPYVAKARHGHSGTDVAIIASREDERRHAALLARPDIMRQNHVGGRFEYAAHFLVRDGSIRFQRTMCHEMATSPVVKGDDALPRRSRPLAGPDPHAARLGKILLELGYEGAACIDYKLAEGVPRILEINPRMGSSLLRSINEWLDAYLVALGIAAPRPAHAQWLVDRRRKGAHRLRRLARALSIGATTPGSRPIPGGEQ